MPLRGFLIGHEVVTAFEPGWSEISNGDLLEMAEKEFDVLVTNRQTAPGSTKPGEPQSRHSGLALRELDQVADACREDRKCHNGDAAGQL